VLASNREAFFKRYAFYPFGEFDGQLDNQGECILVFDAKQDTVAHVKYNDNAPWPKAADGDGYSLVPVDSNGVRDPNNPGNWVASARIHGSPGKDDAASTEKNPPRVIPDQYALYQNYPNPFNRATTITFDIKKDAAVKVIVLNILGKKIATLTDSNYKTGRYSVTWEGQKCASGIYFYQLQIDHTFHSTKKMILCK
jgi:hypothetical protein